MRRSSQVLAPLLAATAVSMLTGCRSQYPKRCVNENNMVVDPAFCQNQNGTNPIAGTMSNGGGYYSNGQFYPHIYRFYYGGYGTNLGGLASGGGYSPVAGHSYGITGTSRGGFGSSFGGGEGGGHGGGE